MFLKHWQFKYFELTKLKVHSYRTSKPTVLGLPCYLVKRLSRWLKTKCVLTNQCLITNVQCQLSTNVKRGQTSNVDKRQMSTNIKRRTQNVIYFFNLFCLGYRFGSRSVPVARRWVASWKEVKVFAALVADGKGAAHLGGDYHSLHYFDLDFCFVD